MQKLLTFHILLKRIVTLFQKRFSQNQTITKEFNVNSTQAR